jgi:glycosyltransferase involved in cell wall biosynthesis
VPNASIDPARDMPRLNTLLIMSYAAPYAGTFVESMLALESELQRRGAAAAFVFPSEARHREWMTRFQAPRTAAFYTGQLLPDARLFASLIRDHGVQIVHTHFAPWTVHASLGLARRRHPSLLSVMHLHNHAQQDRGILKEWVRQRIVKADAYIAVSSDVHDQLLDLGYHAASCGYVTNGVHFGRLDAVDRHAPRERPSGTTHRVLMFGFDFERKGVDLAIEALRRHDPAHRLALAIVVATNAQAVRSRIEDLLGEVPGWIEVLPPREDIATYFAMSDVFISPSREEGFCYALVEAAYCGLPIAASDISGQRSLRIPHTLTFAPENPAALYQAIVQAIHTEPAQAAAFTSEARQYAIERFDVGTWARTMVDTYETHLLRTGRAG